MNTNRKEQYLAACKAFDANPCRETEAEMLYRLEVLNEANN